MNSPDPRCFIEFRPSMRVLIEDAIESLILLSDEIDGDADYEEETDQENWAEDREMDDAECGI
jgi:hypothetical protein